MSNCHGCKEEAINLIPHYLIDIIHKTVKPSHLEKLQIIQNVNKLMFQVIFVFSDWTLLKKIIFSFTQWVKQFSNPPSSWGKQIFKNFYLEFSAGDWGMSKNASLNVFSRNVNTINWKIFPTYGGINKSKKIQQILERDTTLTGLKKYERMCPWSNLEGQGW